MHAIAPRRRMTHGLAVLLPLATLAGWVASAAPAVAGDCGNPHVHHPLLALLPDGAPAVTAVQDGAWSDPATWGGTLPGPGDDVRIPFGTTVTYDIDDDGDGVGPDTTRFHVVRVDGVLTWRTDLTTTMYVDSLISAPEGVVDVGRVDAPIESDVRAEIVIIADEPMTDVPQLSRGVILHGPNQFVGAARTPYAALLGDAEAGATTLTLRAAPIGWAVGDTLVLGGTWYDPDGDDADNSRFHDEVLTVTAINGAVISFTNTAAGVSGLQWGHVRPDGVHFDPDDLTLYVANLTRNVVIRSELDPASPDAPGPDAVQDRRRGHHMAMHTLDVVMRSVAFIDLGRLNKNAFLDDPILNVDGTPGQGLNPRGRYAMHLHRNLPQNSVPLDLSTCVPAEVSHCVVWGSPGWGFVHHDSYALFEENVAFDVVGAAFVQEAGNEIGRWEGNLSIKTTGDDDPNLTVEPFGDGFKRVSNFDFGFNGEAYWIQGAGQVEFIDNIAISAAGGGADVFSDVDGNVNRDRGVVPVEHLRPSIQHIVTNESQTIAVNRVPMHTFRGFEVYNADFGMLTWNHMRNQGAWIGFTCPCDGNMHREYARVEGFRFWNIYGQGIHLQYSSQIEFRDGVIASSDLATPGIDDKPAIDLAINGDGRGFGFGMNGPTKRLRVDDVIIEGWEFGIRTPLEGQINDLDDGGGTGSEGALGLPERRSIYTDLRMANNGDHLYRRQNGFSDPATFANFLEIRGGSFTDDLPNEPPVANFTALSVGPHGVVELSGAAAFDPDTPSGPSPFEPGVGFITNYSVVVNDPNDIVAYAWDLDDDGAFDAYGERVTTTLPLGVATPIRLQVWDHQGATNAITLPVTATAAAYPELLVDGDLAIPVFNDGSIHSGSSDLGWFTARATLEDGGARLDGEFGSAWIGQAVYDARARRGVQALRFGYELHEGHDDPNNGEISRLRVRVWGLDSEFTAAYREYPVAAGAIPYDETLLYDEWFVTPTDLTTVERLVDFGTDGFTYVMISLHASGVSDAVPGDYAWIDDVSITGTTTACPDADLNGDLTVDFSDLLALLQCWSESGGACAAADLDDDGVVSFSDLTQLIADWGPCS